LAVLGNFLRVGAFPHRLQCWIATRLVFLLQTTSTLFTCARRFLMY
jgi:hypothetical protein